jgi:periplasmic divalent cation tolerance protein
MMQEIAIVGTTVRDESEARGLVSVILQHRQAACIQCENVTSSYRWNGNVENEKEIRMTCKTTIERATSLGELIVSHHSYDLPELVVQTVQVSDAYANWVRSEVTDAI